MLYICFIYICYIYVLYIYIIYVYYIYIIYVYYCLLYGTYIYISKYIIVRVSRTSPAVTNWGVTFCLTHLLGFYAPSRTM